MLLALKGAVLSWDDSQKLLGLAAKSSVLNPAAIERPASHSAESTS